jgi:hypothetical protein
MNDEQINKMSDLEKIKNILKGFLKDYLSTCSYYFFNIDDINNTIEITIRKDDEINTTLILRLGLSYTNQEIYVYNIFLPVNDRKQNIGLGTINILFKISKLIGFALVLHSMTDGFYNAMLKRNAKATLEPDCLQITEDTDLGELKFNN